MSTAPRPRGGWHWSAWGAEFGGTAALMFAVATAKVAAIAAGPPYSGLRFRIAIIGAVAGLAVVGVALSPWGRRSGAHLNPAVTFGLWRLGVVSHADLAGYSIAQLAGGVAGIAAGRVWGGRIAGGAVDWAIIAPGPSTGTGAATAWEAAATALQLAVVFALLGSERYRSWTAPAAGALLAVAIVALATVSGAGFNPVRGLAPDIVAGSYPGWWVFVVGPMLGAVLAAGAVRVLRIASPLTGKLWHDPRFRCWLRCAIPHTTPKSKSSDEAPPPVGTEAEVPAR
jgi:aquaporin Z